MQLLKGRSGTKPDRLTLQTKQSAAAENSPGGLIPDKNLNSVRIIGCMRIFVFGRRMAAILIEEQNMAYFGDVQEVLRILDELKMSQPFLAGLLDNKPSNSTLSAWLKGQLFLPGD